MTLKSYVEIELNGKQRVLKFDFNAVADVEEYFGKGLMKIFHEDQVGFSTIRIFYWAGLKWKERGITPQVVGTWLQKKIDDGMDFADLMKPVMKALRLSGVLGSSQEEENEEDENENFEEQEKN